MKKIVAIVLAVVLTSTLSLAGATPVCGANATLEPMVHYSEPGTYCGPCSGTSIGGYYKFRDRDGNGLGDYPGLPNVYPVAYNDMYHRLYDYMDTLSSGYTNWNAYGPGFVEMALHYGYDNFSYVYYAPESDAGPVNEAFYGVIKNAIDNGWPVALAAIQPLKGFRDVEALPGSDGSGWPCTVWHWIAIKGYYDEYMGHDHVVICTDSYSHANNLYLDWYDLVAEVTETYLRAVIIKDEDTVDPYGPYVEDFEWGSDGVRLEYWQNYGGEVDWEISTPGTSAAEIDDTAVDPTAQAHTGTKSARFYRGPSGGGPYAWYSLFRPSYISFWLKKSDTAYAEFRLGDGTFAIWARVNSAEQVQYYDTSYHTLSGTLYLGNWHHIEFKNIYWSTGKYDIYVNGIRKVQGANMRSWGTYNGMFYFGSWTGSGTFWIDDINDSVY